MGSSFGTLFRVTTWGESHGGGVGVVVDGCPPRLALSEGEVQRELDRRRPGQSRITTQRDEADRVQILSGLVVCFFARGIYHPETVARALEVVGFNIGTDDFGRIGERVLRQKYRFKFREGLSLDGLRIPRRILDTPALVRDWDEGYVRKTVEAVARTLSAERTQSGCG